MDKDITLLIKVKHSKVQQSFQHNFNRHNEQHPSQTDGDDEDYLNRGPFCFCCCQYGHFQLYVMSEWTIAGDYSTRSVLWLGTVYRQGEEPMSQSFKYGCN